MLATEGLDSPAAESDGAEDAGVAEAAEGSLLGSLGTAGLVDGTLFGSDSFTGQKTMRPRGAASKQRIERNHFYSPTRPANHARHSLLGFILLRSGTFSQDI